MKPPKISLTIALILAAVLLPGCVTPAIVRINITEREAPEKMLQIFRWRHPAGVIQRIVGEQFQDHITSYEIHFTENGRQLHMTFDSASDLLVPAEIYAAFETQHPDADLHSIKMWNDTEEGPTTRYAIDFKEKGKRLSIDYDPTGKQISEPIELNAIGSPISK